MPPVFFVFYLRASSLSKVKPLKGFNSFSSLFKTGKKFYEDNALGVFLFDFDKYEATNFTKSIDSEFFYLGVSVSKKNAKKAVVRNRIKRLLREAVKKIFQERYTQCEHHLRFGIIVWRAGVSHPAQIKLSDVYPALVQIFDNVDRFYKSKKIKAQ